MAPPATPSFVWMCFRVGGEPQGICNKRGAADLIQYLEGELADRGMSSLVTSAGCLKVCDRGPAMVVYPKGDWYGNLSEEAIDEILDAMEESSVAEKYLLT